MKRGRVERGKVARGRVERRRVGEGRWKEVGRKGRAKAEDLH